MSIPTTCYHCGLPLEYTPDRPNQLEEGKPLVKWICGECWKTRHTQQIREESTMNEKILREILEDEKHIVRVTCHNYLQEPMFGERLQDTVIFHLENYTKNIISAFNNERGDKN